VYRNIFSPAQARQRVRPSTTNFTFEVDAFATLRADDARAFEAGQIFGLDFDFDPLFVEEDFRRRVARNAFCWPTSFAEFGRKSTAVLGAFPGGDADGAAVWRSRNGATLPVAKFRARLPRPQLATSATASGDAPVRFQRTRTRQKTSASKKRTRNSPTKSSSTNNGSKSKSSPKICPASKALASSARNVAKASTSNVKS